MSITNTRIQLQINGTKNCCRTSTLMYNKNHRNSRNNNYIDYIKVEVLVGENKCNKLACINSDFKINEQMNIMKKSNIQKLIS